MMGCASQNATTYTPSPNQSVVYEQGIGVVTQENSEVALVLYPTYKYQADFPTFTLVIENKTDHNIEFVPESVHGHLGRIQYRLFTLDERIAKLRSAARKRKAELAVAGIAAAGAVAYGASHQTFAYETDGRVGNRHYHTTGFVQVYDPAAGVLAGAIVGDATAAGIQQIDQGERNEEWAAYGILQRTTIGPGATIVGQLIFRSKERPFQYGLFEAEIPIGTSTADFTFTERTKPR